MKKFLPILAALGFLVVVNFLLIRWVGDWRQSARQEALHGSLIHEVHSDYAHIRVREKGSQRSLLFVEPDGTELLQSRIDVERPGELQLRYTRAIFVSFLIHEKQEQVLIVGLGGGGMVRYLNETQPETRVTAVEIDPEVVAVAEAFFGTKSGPRAKILTEDAFVYLRETADAFDAIYMDAFLRPPAGEEALQEKAQRLKTTAFLGEIRDRLRPGGIVAFNLIEAESTTEDDLAAIREVFDPVYVFAVAETGNLVVIGATSGERLSREALQSRAIAREENSDSSAPGEGLPLEAVVEGLREEED